MVDRPRVLSNDDGWILSSYEPPITIEQMRDNMVGPHAGSAIDTFLWSVGGREVLSYETVIGERFADGVEDFANEADRVRALNLRHLIEHHGGPVTAIARLCREAGRRFFPSLRMNTHYNTEEDSLSFGRFRRDHPDLLIGRADDPPYGSTHWGLRTGKDYAFPQVRDFMVAIACELLERFDVDGIELDFMRHPGVFRPEQGYANRHLLTDMVRQLRARMDEIGKAKGRALELEVRVASSLYDSERLGMEAERWMKEGLVDIVVTGLGFRPFEAKVAEFAAAAEGTGCQVLGCFEGLRPVVETEVLRAMAARYWDAGADGLYFFNFYSMSADWKRHTVGELADPERLARLSKQYQIDRGNPPSVDSQIGHAFRHCMPLEQLPLRLEETRADARARLTFDLADDVAAAEREGALESCVLGLAFADLDEVDEVVIHLNGIELSWDQRRIRDRPWTEERYDGEWNRYPSRTRAEPLDWDPVEFTLLGSELRKGSNELLVGLIRRETAPALLLESVRIWIRYA